MSRTGRDVRDEFLRNNGRSKASLRFSTFSVVAAVTSSRVHGRPFLNVIAWRVRRGIFIDAMDV